ncbi:MAG: hypothetical protein U1F53_00890 [Burkholderiaceae bacterium]
MLASRRARAVGRAAGEPAFGERQRVGAQRGQLVGLLKALLRQGQALPRVAHVLAHLPGGQRGTQQGFVGQRVGLGTLGRAALAAADQAVQRRAQAPGRVGGAGHAVVLQRQLHRGVGAAAGGVARGQGLGGLGARHGQLRLAAQGQHGQRGQAPGLQRPGGGVDAGPGQRLLQRRVAPVHRGQLLALHLRRVQRPRHVGLEGAAGQRGGEGGPACDSGGSGAERGVGGHRVSSGRWSGRPMLAAPPRATKQAKPVAAGGRRVPAATLRRSRRP